MSNVIRCPECESHNMRLLGKEFPSYQVQCAECRTIISKYSDPGYQLRPEDTDV